MMSNMMKLSEKNLENAAGGYVYYSTTSHGYEVIDDKTGNVLARDWFWEQEDAEKKAKELGQSMEELDVDELTELRTTGTIKVIKPWN